MLANASGYPFNGVYIEEVGDLAADLLSDIASEQRAKVVYEYLYRQIPDTGVRESIDFLLNREEAHNTLFRQVFNTLEGTGSLADWGKTFNSKEYFNLSTPGDFYNRKNLTTPKPPKFNISNQPNQQGFVQQIRRSDISQPDKRCKNRSSNLKSPISLKFYSNAGRSHHTKDGSLRTE